MDGLLELRVLKSRVSELRVEHVTLTDHLSVLLLHDVTLLLEVGDGALRVLDLLALGLQLSLQLLDHVVFLLDHGQGLLIAVFL